MSQDIKNINTYETRPKVNVTKWILIYEVIDEAYVKQSNIALMILSENVISEDESADEAVPIYTRK